MPVRGLRRFAGGVGLLLLLGGLSACGETGPVFRNVSVEVTPSDLSLDAIGAEASFTAVVNDGRGDPVFGARVRWSVSDPSIASVDESGTVTAVAPGSTTVTATASGLGLLEASGSATVRVVPVVQTVTVLSDGGGTSAAGTPLPDPVRVRAVDRLGGPVAGTLLRFEVVEGGGAAAPEASLTDAEGVATTTWKLGQQAGAPQRLAVSVGDGPGLRVVEAAAVAGPPAALAADPPPPSFWVRGRALDAPVRVRVVDVFGNPVAGAPVAFTPVAGAGSVTPNETASDAAGYATTQWTLGADAGPQTLEARADAASADLIVTATETPTSLAPVAGTAQAAAVGTAVAVAPTVRVTDAGGEAVPGVPVAFEVTAGGGTIEAADAAPTTTTSAAAAFTGASSSASASAAPIVVLTDADGRAALGRWVLGTIAGPGNDVVRASVEGLPAAVFTARADPGPATTLVILSGDAQTAAVTTAVPSPPTVRADDAWGNAVPGAAVRFVPEDGYVTAAEIDTGSSGTASTGWVLGPVAGEQRLRVELANEASQVAFRATGTGTASLCSLPVPGPGFQIHICPLSPLDPTAEAALSDALARWEAVVVGDLEDVVPAADHTTCLSGAPWLDGVVDDLVLYVDVAPVDGAGGALAGAAPCSVRPRDGLPTIARLRVDRDDVEPLATAGQLVDVLTHEIGHALGIGTLWGAFGLLQDPAAGVAGPPPDTWFSGPQAIAAFDAAGGASRTAGPKVPVQNRGGGGVVDLHWRETVLGPELMTAQLDPGVPNPLSAITVASLADLGYVVDMNRSDPFVVPFPNFPTAEPTSRPPSHSR